jgi:hypothetical protein
MRTWSMEHDGFPLKGCQIQRADVYRGGVKTPDSL